MFCVRAQFRLELVDRLVQRAPCKSLILDQVCLSHSRVTFGSCLESQTFFCLESDLVLSQICLS